MSIKQKNNNFLVFSDDFGEHPSSCQHLFHHISQANSVLWVNTIGMRSPKLTKRDILKAFTKLEKMFLTLLSKEQKTAVVSNIRVCQPFMLPFIKIPLVRKFNKNSVVEHVRKQLKHLNIHSPIMVISAPNACDYINQFDESTVVYYCVDDYSEWPGLEQELVNAMQNKIIENADIFIATSIDLCEKIKNRGKQVNLLTHGVDIEFFSATDGNEHELLADIPKPRAGYFGLFDDRSNKELLIETARLLPDVSFVITGGIETDVSGLKKTGNIYFTGSVPYSELASMAKGYDICLLPYKINKLTDAIQPLKFKEYIATGKPIISTSIKEADKFKEYVTIADSAAEWAESISRNLKGSSSIGQEKRSQFIQNQSWAQKAKEFLGFVYDKQPNC